MLAAILAHEFYQFAVLLFRPRARFSVGVSAGAGVGVGINDGLRVWTEAGAGVGVINEPGLLFCRRRALSFKSSFRKVYLVYNALTSHKLEFLDLDPLSGFLLESLVALSASKRLYLHIRLGRRKVDVRVGVGVGIRVGLCVRVGGGLRVGGRVTIDVIVSS